MGTERRCLHDLTKLRWEQPRDFDHAEVASKLCAEVHRPSDEFN
jgi:hypothetical protein